MTALFIYTSIMCMLQYSAILNSLLQGLLFAEIIIYNDDSPTVTILIVNMLKGFQPPFRFSFGQVSKGFGDSASFFEGGVQHMFLRTMAKEGWSNGGGGPWTWCRVGLGVVTLTATGRGEVTAKKRIMCW